MIVSIMQPYLFPYIGYFQLINQCDLFVIYDDVQYKKGGWINRNRILYSGRPHWFTIPVVSAPHTSPINARCFALDPDLRQRLIGHLFDAYRRAPCRDDIHTFLSDALKYEDHNVAAFNGNSIRNIANKLGIATKIAFSSDLGLALDLRGQDRVLEICNQLGASVYLNAIGGVDLYDQAVFDRRGIKLRFLRTGDVTYRQVSAGFVPNLSIIDLLMHCDDSERATHLRNCELIG